MDVQSSQPRQDDGSILEQLILGIAHELNNPNTFIRVNAMNMQKLFSMLNPCMAEFNQNHPDHRFGSFSLPEIQGKIYKMIESIMEASVRLITISDKLKQCGSLAPNTQTQLNLKEIIDRVLEIHQFLLDGKIAITINADPADTYPLMGHQLQLEQALSILITNASDAIGDRCKEVPDHRGAMAITLRREQDGKIMIIVEDNGCGMPQDIMAKIFNPYFSTKPHGTGDGLGLSIFRSIISRHGGQIGVTSRPGEGTVFQITFPGSTTA